MIVSDQPMCPKGQDPVINVELSSDVQCFVFTVYVHGSSLGNQHIILYMGTVQNVTVLQELLIAL